MAKILDITEIKLDWSDLNVRVEHVREQHKRSKGVHVSGVLKYVAQEMKILKPRAEDEIDEMPMVVAAGFAMEGLLSGLYPHMMWQPGEVKRQGIVGSPDGVSMLSITEGRGIADTVIEEFKLTYKSLRTRVGDAILNEWLWMEQMKAYCNMYVDRPVHARLHVWFACGDYQYPLKPRYMRYLIEFGRQELANNWSLLQKYKSFAIAE